MSDSIEEFKSDILELNKVVGVEDSPIIKTENEENINELEEESLLKEYVENLIKNNSIVNDDIITNTKEEDKILDTPSIPLEESNEDELDKLENSLENIEAADTPSEESNEEDLEKEEDQEIIPVRDTSLPWQITYCGSLLLFVYGLQLFMILCNMTCCKCKNERICLE